MPERSEPLPAAPEARAGWFARAPAPSRGVVIVGLLITFMGGYLLGALGRGPREEDALAEARSATRVQIPVGFSPSNGPEDALVTVVEFADFQCPYCSRSVGLQRRLLAEYPKTVRWVFEEFPLDFHRNARPAARAALAAHAQGQFWAFHDRLFADQDHLSSTDLLKAARELGLDMARFRTEVDGRGLDRLINEDIDLGRKVGVKGTPSLYVNGRALVGASYEELDKVVRQELLWAADRLRGGVPRARIYEELTRPTSPPAPTPTAPSSQPAAAAALVPGAPRAAHP